MTDRNRVILSLIICQERVIFLYDKTSISKLCIAFSEPVEPEAAPDQGASADHVVGHTACPALLSPKTSIISQSFQ